MPAIERRAPGTFTIRAGPERMTAIGGKTFFMATVLGQTIRDETLSVIDSNDYNKFRVLIGLYYGTIIL